MSLHDGRAGGLSPVGVLDPQVVARYRPGLFEKIAGLYLDMAPRMVQEAQSALGQGDAATVRQNCHTLKSSGANVGALEFSALCRQLEAAALDGDPETASALLPRFLEAHEAAIEALNTCLG